MILTTTWRSALMVTLACGAATSPAYACMSSGPDGFSSGLVWKTVPNDLPGQVLVLQFEYVRSVPRMWAGFVAKVRSGPPQMVGRDYRFRPEIANSCVSLGRRRGFIVVRRTPVANSSDTHGSSLGYLSAISYKESWLNWLLRSFSDDSWQFAGGSNRLEVSARNHTTEWAAK